MTDDKIINIAINKAIDIKSELEISLEKKIFSIISEFNFENVHIHMLKTSWNWCSVTENGTFVYYIPEIKQLQETATRLLKDCVEHFIENKTYVYYATGGFKATIFEDETLLLEFIIEEYEE